MGRPKIKRVRLTVSDDVYKRLSKISEEARMPLQLVYDDALLNGICTLPDMYKSAIEFRKTRDEMIQEPARATLRKPEPNGDEVTESEELSFDASGDSEFVHIEHQPEVQTTEERDPAEEEDVPF